MTNEDLIVWANSLSPETLPDADLRYRIRLMAARLRREHEDVQTLRKYINAQPELG